MKYVADSTPLSARTNDDFTLSVSVDYDISSLTPKFKLKTSNSVIDWSSYIVKTSSTSFSISVPASKVDDITPSKVQYDCILDAGNGEKDFLFGGILTITGGIS